ncbi:unnamed protein product, partial [Mesorhabditis belari]|uniref:TROVE domain-containing protein n=1 Tax=Mesorhabditis belari TaxID=2138241 RepID=A0AAF3E8T1_9BILA
MTSIELIEQLRVVGLQFSACLEQEREKRKEHALIMIPQEGAGFELAVPQEKAERTEGSETEGFLASNDGKPSGQMTKNRDDQVMNTAGGYVFAVSDETRVRRFLILGTSGGTFYASEKELTMDNLAALIAIIEKGSATMILHELREISLAGRNPKQDPLMFALALCARYRVCDVNKTHADLSNLYTAYLKAMHKAALSLVNEVCRIPTHLFAFVEYCELISRETAANPAQKSTGWGRSLRETICNWYTSKSPKQLAQAVTKYGQRGGWSHRDLFRLSHPKVPVSADDPSLLELQQIYHYIVKGTLKTRKRRLSAVEQAEQQPANTYTSDQMDRENDSEALDLIETFKSLSQETPENDVVDAIKKKGLVREHIPSQHLNSVSIWEALLEKMPMTAMLRNLSKMQALDMLKGTKITELCDKLTDEAAIRVSRVHPIQILIAHHMYSQGRGDKGKLTWRPNPTIENALEKAFYASFKNVEATGKRFCFAFDVSSSMNSSVSGSSITNRKASVAMGMIGLRTEENVEVVAFCDQLTEIPFDKSWTLEQTCNYFDRLDFGSTDCAQPMIWARENRKDIDCFMVFTDNETYFGEVHPYEALQKYRESSGIADAKLIVLGMTSTGFTIADPNDAGMLDICGFDAAIPELVASFVKGLL